jgi:hypothetical protein
VLFFTGVGCPIVRKSAPKLADLESKFGKEKVRFWIVNSYPEDEPEEIKKELGELKLKGFTTLRDPRQGLAAALNVKRTAEVVAVRLSDRAIFYRGAIDDQYAEGSELPEPKERFLENALTQFVAGEAVAVSKTEPHGCRLAFAKVGGADGLPSYSREVAPILQEHCVNCHRRGDIGQWNMENYGKVKNKSAMIAEVLLERRMPPWNPDPDYGHFSNENRLSREELQTLLRWAEAGAPRGEGPDPLTEPLPALPEWELGKPDVVLRPKEMQKIPATGVLQYRNLPLEFKRDRELWISGIEVKPGNRKVVHHAVLYAKWPGCPEGDKNGVILLAWAPGVPAVRLPPGVGKRLPADATLSIEMHYTVCGSEQTDITETALYFWPEAQARSVETRAAIEWDLNIVPGADESRHAAVHGFKKPATIYSLFPHMHVRGKSMRYQLLLPDGTSETLLNVPGYDFSWQFVYLLKEPRPVPAGSWLLVTGAFDNSAAKHGNPDPTKRVHFGAQSWEEMFIGFFEAADDPPSEVIAARAQLPVPSGDSTASQ